MFNLRQVYLSEDSAGSSRRMSISWRVVGNLGAPLGLEQGDECEMNAVVSSGNPLMVGLEPGPFSRTALEGIMSTHGGEGVRYSSPASNSPP